MLDEFLKSLNEKQKQAVEAPLEPVLVLAGPGTGKTRLLTARIAWLIANDKEVPDRILALTFTNKAAGELQTRLGKLLGAEAGDINCGTIHGFALNMIRRYHRRLGLSPHFSVCDQEYQRRLVRELSAPFIRENIENKIRGILLSFSNHQMKGKPLSTFAAERFAEYREHLQKHNLIDFDQIILFCHNLVSENEDIRKEYGHLYRSVLVDEFQDTDPLQYEIIHALAREHRNIFVVADDDQSIYAWRGASPKNIQRYMNDFGIDKAFFLDINYRSGDRILRQAQEIIATTDRIEPNKSLRVSHHLEDRVQAHFFASESDEINFIVQQIKDWSAGGSDYSEIAVIYPFHYFGNELENRFLKGAIPYQIASGRSLMDNELVHRIVLYLRLVRDPDDYVSLEELSERVLGQALYLLIKQYTARNKVNFRKALYAFYREQAQRIAFDDRIKIKELVEQIGNLVNLKNFYIFSRFVREIASFSEFEQTSYLARHATAMEDVDICRTINPDYLVQADVIQVWHSNGQIAWLAKELLNQILKKKIVVFEPGQDSDNAAVLALEPLEQLQGKQLIPVYVLKNDVRRGSLSALFKLLQFIAGRNFTADFDSYIIFDLETTGRDVSTCRIVEFAAIRVEKGKVTAKLQSLIDPRIPIPDAARAVHHISDDDVKGQPTIEEFWPQLIQFIGNDILIAHNGYAFDFPILDRTARKLDGKRLSNPRFDTLTLARNLFPQQKNSIDALVDRFGLDAGTRHRALDDVLVLNEIYRRLHAIKSSLLAKSSLEMFLEFVALGNFLENNITAREDRIFFQGGVRKLLSPYSMIRDAFVDSFSQEASKLVDALQQHKELDERYNAREHLLTRLLIMTEEFDSLSNEQAIPEFLARISLNSSQDNLENLNAVSLLTYHAAKGLEFEKVILMGMEDGNMPAYHASREDSDDDRPVSKKMEEQRRLLYVGMTRAKNELIFTAVRNRGGRDRESSPFLRELKVPRTITN